MKEKNVKLEMEDGDLDILKEGTVDFISISYYMSRTERKDKDREKLIAGNIIGGVKNPYLKASDWAGKSIRLGHRSLWTNCGSGMKYQS